MNSLNNKLSIIFIITFLFLQSLTMFSVHKPFSQPITQTAANHLYIASQLSSGHLLYRDIVSDKPPMNEYVLFLSALISKGSIYSYVVLSRFVYFIFYFISTILLYIIARNIFKNTSTAFLVSIISLSFGRYYYVIATRGADWHVLMNLFGLLTILFFMKRRYIYCGLCAALATLTWMPGLIFVMGSLEGALFLPSNKKYKTIVAIFSGFSVTIFALLLYYLFAGNLSDFIKQTILYGTINVPHEFVYGFKQIPRVIKLHYSENIPLIIIGVLGFFIHGFQLSSKRFVQWNIRSSFLPMFVLLATYVYSVIDFQWYPDFIPFVPWLSLTTGYALESVPQTNKQFYVRTLFTFIIIVFVIFSLKHSDVKEIQTPLNVQIQITTNVLDECGVKEEDALFCIRSALPVLLTSKKNMMKYLYYFDKRNYDFIEKYEYHGFNHVMDTFKKKKPGFVCAPKNISESSQHLQKFNILLKENYRVCGSFHEGAFVMYSRKLK